MTKQHGYSLLELLFSLLLGTIVLSLVIEALLVYQHSYRQLNNNNHLQEQMRFSSHIISSTVETAGYIGCAGLADHFPLVANGSSEVITADNAVQIFSSNSSHLPNFISGKLAPNSQVLVIRQLMPISDVLLSPADNSSDLIVSNTVPLNAGDTIVLSDCRHGELLKIKSVSLGQQQQITTTQALHFAYHAGAQIGALEVIAFYIADTGRIEQGRPIYALYQGIAGQARQELVPDVESMSVQRDRRLVHINLQFPSLLFHIDIPLSEYL
ncbi:MAG: prepilin-type N-terminal cleavage/methylation domain-containing protein [Pseudomonadota bacterium]